MRPFVQRLRDNLLQRFVPSQLLDALGLLFNPEAWPSDAEQRANFVPPALRIVTDWFGKSAADEEGPPVTAAALEREWRTCYRSYAYAQYARRLQDVLDVARKNNSDSRKAIVMRPSELMRLLVCEPLHSLEMPSWVALARIALTVVMSTAIVERGFSALRRIKTHLRNSLSNETLDGLLFVALHGEADETKFNPAPVFEQWRKAKERRVFEQLQAQHLRNEHLLGKRKAPQDSDAAGAAEQCAAHAAHAETADELREVDMEDAESKVRCEEIEEKVAADCASHTSVVALSPRQIGPDSPIGCSITESAVSRRRSGSSIASFFRPVPRDPPAVPQQSVAAAPSS